MNITEEINKIFNIDESYKAPERVLEILYGNIEERNDVFRKLLKLWDYKVDFDNFHEYFEVEHSDRKVKKQDFTPESVALLLSRLTSDSKGTFSYLDVCAGTGGITISKWCDVKYNYDPWNYRPNDHIYYCEEMSDRAIPFLLLNLMIRGITAVVVQCDVLSRESKGIFFVQNSKNDAMSFSDFNVMPYSKEVADYFHVNFTNEVYAPHIESELINIG